MDGTILNLGIFLAATFAASLITGVAGFAFGLVAAAVWLHILSPVQTATLIIASIAFVSASVVNAQDNFRMLGEKDIRARVVGKDLTDRAHWAIYLRPDGVLVRTGMNVPENGIWKIQNNKFCMLDPISKLPNCSYVWMAGERISLRMKEKADANDFDAFVEKHRGN